MIRVELDHETDFNGWRAAARHLCLAGVSPADVDWTVPGSAPSLLDGGTAMPTLPTDATPLTVTRQFVDKAQRVICHRDPARFARLYTLLWRLQKTPGLLANSADGDVAWLEACNKAIRRDRHKMHAFVRFRKIGERTDLAGSPREQFAAWFEPEHRITELAAPFFQRRFPNMDWAIVTPEKTAVWDGASLTFAPGGTRADVPEEDAVEEQWQTYFSSIFNPARLKVHAMTAEMPRKYWANLPEAKLIPAMINSARERQRMMEEHAVSQPNVRARKLADRLHLPEEAGGDIASLDQVASALTGCTACPLYRDASQAVMGEGPTDARLMIVGEQPGDQEDIAGRPFVGPAGKVLDDALEKAGLDRREAYVTNAVKHFKFTLRGRRRQHARPSASEIDYCRRWLEIERDFVRPDLIVALGASAARGLMGKTVKIAEMRSQLIGLEGGAQLVITVHPSYLLRLPDPAAKVRETERFIEDLALARSVMMAAA